MDLRNYIILHGHSITATVYVSLITVSSHFVGVFQQQRAMPPANLHLLLTHCCSQSAHFCPGFPASSGGTVSSAAVCCWCLPLLNRTFLLAHNLLNHLRYI